MTNTNYESAIAAIENDLTETLAYARDESGDVNGRGSAYHEAYYEAMLAEEVLKAKLPCGYKAIEAEYHQFRDENPDYDGWGDCDPDFRYRLKNRESREGKPHFGIHEMRMMKDIHDSLEIAKDEEMPAESRGNGYHDALSAADIAHSVLKMELPDAFRYSTIIAEYYAWRDRTPEYPGWPGNEADDSYRLQKRMAGTVEAKN